MIRRGRKPKYDKEQVQWMKRRHAKGGSMFKMQTDFYKRYNQVIATHTLKKMVDGTYGTQMNKDYSACERFWAWVRENCKSIGNPSYVTHWPLDHL